MHVINARAGVSVDPTRRFQVEGTFKGDANLVCVTITFTCWRRWPCPGMGGGTWAFQGRVSLQQMSDGDSDSHEDTSALQM